MPVSIVQKALMQLVLKKDGALEEAFRKIFQQFKGQPNCPLLHDLGGYQRSLSQKQQKNDSFVTNTDDWQDLFLSGTEVIGSCQSITAGSSTNRCLMGYVLDGKKNRMIAVKSNKTGKIQARAIFRILFKEGRPALFIDRVYSCFPTCPEVYSQAILNHAKNVATDLGLKLYSIGGAHRLDSLGSTVELEYEDAATGITNGVFTIVQAKLV